MANEVGWWGDCQYKCLSKPCHQQPKWPSVLACHLLTHYYSSQLPQTNILTPGPRSKTSLELAAVLCHPQSPHTPLLGEVLQLPMACVCPFSMILCLPPACLDYSPFPRFALGKLWLICQVSADKTSPLQSVTWWSLA
jgi:hypothetical protein